MHRLYLVPTLLINVVIILIPALLTVALAFFRWDGITAPSFVGLTNFQALWSDRIFWTALTNNIIWTALFLVVPIGIGLLAATLLLNIQASDHAAVVQKMVVALASVTEEAKRNTI